MNLYQSQGTSIYNPLINNGLLFPFRGAGGLGGIPSYWEWQSHCGPRKEDYRNAPDHHF